MGCFQYDKDSKMKANHNPGLVLVWKQPVVSSTTKIVKWKQITTQSRIWPCWNGCFQYDKDSKMKANHNSTAVPTAPWCVVSSTTKIVKWKQITTLLAIWHLLLCCFQYDKDSKMKANHNRKQQGQNQSGVVSSTTKIVKWKQITTELALVQVDAVLFPVRQR